MIKTYTIKVSAIQKVEEMSKKFLKKAATHGLEGFTVSVLEDTKRYIEAINFDPTVMYKTAIEVVDVLFVGNSPEVKGYRLIASIEKTPSGNIIKSVSNEYDLSKYRASELYCEHCKTHRAKKYSLVLETPKKTLMQVGKTCVSQYLNDKKIEDFLEYMDRISDFLETLEYDESKSDRVPNQDRSIDNETIVSHAIAAIRKWGWVSKSKARETRNILSTADVVLTALFGSKRNALDVTKEDLAEAKMMLDWAKMLDGGEDYFYNLKVIVNNGYVGYRNVGYIASLPVAYRKANAKKEPEINNEWVGFVGEKLEKEVEVEKVYQTESYYGTTLIISYRTPDGDILVTFTSPGTKAANVEVGEFLKIKGTVKEQTMFRNVKQTVISRVSIMEKLKLA